MMAASTCGLNSQRVCTWIISELLATCFTNLALENSSKLLNIYIYHTTLEDIKAFLIVKLYHHEGLCLKGKERRNLRTWQCKDERINKWTNECVNVLSSEKSYNRCVYIHRREKGVNGNGFLLGSRVYLVWLNANSFLGCLSTCLELTVT